jgi:hypothetical protein
LTGSFYIATVNIMQSTSETTQPSSPNQLPTNIASSTQAPSNYLKKLLISAGIITALALAKQAGI